MAKSFHKKPHRATYKTYSTIDHRGNTPSLYEIVTSRLLYYPQLGFEIPTPAAEWIKKYQINGSLSLKDLDRYYDPLEMTYTKYTALQQEKELSFSKKIQKWDLQKHVAALSSEWLTHLNQFFAPLVYPLHGLQMVAAYLGHLSPSSRVVNTLMFQAANDMKKIYKIAYWTAIMNRFKNTFGMDRQKQWEENPTWQPLRRLIENLLITYDWGEALVVLNICIRPLIDKVLLEGYAKLASKNNDDAFGEVMGFCAEDSFYQKRWTKSLIDFLVGIDPLNKMQINNIFFKWSEQTREAFLPFVLINHDLSFSEIDFKKHFIELQTLFEL